LEILQRRVSSPHLLTGLGGGEHPLDARIAGVSLALPSRDLGLSTREDSSILSASAPNLSQSGSERRHAARP
jgi:hypothetical protein